MAKALALGADAVSIGVASLIALGCNRQAWFERRVRPLGRRHRRLRALGTAPGYCHHCHTGRCPVGHHHARPGARGPPRPRGRGPVGDELPPGDDDGADDAGPGMRQDRRPPPRTARTWWPSPSRPLPWPRSRSPVPAGSPAGPDPRSPGHLGAISATQPSGRHLCQGLSRTAPSTHHPRVDPRCTRVWPDRGSAAAALVVGGALTARPQVRRDPSGADVSGCRCRCEMIVHGGASGYAADVPPYAKPA